MNYYACRTNKIISIAQAASHHPLIGDGECVGAPLCLCGTRVFATLISDAASFYSDLMDTQRMEHSLSNMKAENLNFHIPRFVHLFGDSGEIISMNVQVVTLVIGSVSEMNMEIHRRLDREISKKFCVFTTHKKKHNLLFGKKYCDDSHIHISHAHITAHFRSKLTLFLLFDRHINRNI